MRKDGLRLLGLLLIRGQAPRPHLGPLRRRQEHGGGLCAAILGTSAEVDDSEQRLEPAHLPAAWILQLFAGRVKASMAIFNAFWPSRPLRSAKCHEVMRRLV